MDNKILIVDDEHEIADLVELYLKNENYTVFKYYTATEALECIDKTEFDLAILDIMLPASLVMNINTHECFLHEKTLSLTPTEFRVLRILCENKGNVVSSEQLFHEIWGDEYFSKSNNTITVHIRHLREKMNDSIDHPKYIKTVWGVAIKLKRKENLDIGYEKFIRRIFLQSVCLMGLSILIIGAVYLLIWRGNAGDWVVSFFQSAFHMRYNEALHLYNLGLRQNFEVIFIGAVAITFIILLRFSLKRFTRYFNSIHNGMNALIEGDGSNIVLMSEMEAIEKKLNTVRLTLEQRSRDAQLAEQRKNDLLMYLAHDIKTPLTSVIGYLSLLDEAPDMSMEQKAKYVHISLDKSYRLKPLIDEFFEITRYNLQTIALAKTNIDLSYMLVQIADEFYPQLAANGKQAVIHAFEDLTIYGDPDKLARVFNNILKNAAAYSEANRVIDITGEISGDRVSIAF